jgi:MFS family permease
MPKKARRVTRASARPALEGSFLLASAMGISRFAYTALLPSTQRTLGVGDDVAGALASINLIGYLAGVLAARHLAARPARGPVLRVALLATVGSTALLGATASVPAWAALRLLAGIASGLVFVLASAAALEAAGERAGILYSGVGLGIALSGAVSALTPETASPGVPWLVLGAATAAMCAPGWRGLATSPPPAASGARAPAAPAGGIGLRRLAISYFLEGFGYIVSGTFAVAVVRRTPGLEAIAPWTWVLTGLAAAPSALLWDGASRRFGARPVLATAFLLQAGGMALSGTARSAAAALAGAALFGGTFMGITTLSMAAARALAPAAPGRILGTLTALYGVGQILGPTIAGAISKRAGDPRPAVLLAAGCVAIGGAVLAAGERRALRATSS